MIRLVVCSSTPAMRAGLRTLIGADPELEVTAAVPDLADLPGWAPEIGLVVATPDALPARWEAEPLSDPGLSELSILLVSDDARDARFLLGLELRAWGMVSAESTAEALHAAIHALAEGLVVAPPDVLQQLVEHMPAGDMEAEKAGTPADRLTGREIDVLRCLARGMPNKQIAMYLQISEHTVKFHVSSIYAKLGVSNRTEAGRKGTRLGIIPL